MKLKGRMKRLERDFRKSTVGAIKENCFKMVYLGDPDHEEQVEKIKNDWIKKYGSLQRLRVFRSNIGPRRRLNKELYDKITKVD